MDLVYKPPLVVQLDCTFTIAPVPEAIVTLLTIRSFIVYQKHILLFTSDIGNHSAAPGSLIHVPDDLVFGLVTFKARAAECPEL